MKQAVNFRLSTQAISALAMLENKMHISKTEIVERAIQAFIKKQLTKQSPLLNFAGILSDKDAENMLEIINSSKHNKDIDIDL